MWGISVFRGTTTLHPKVAESQLPKMFWNPPYHVGFGLERPIWGTLSLYPVGEPLYPKYGAQTVCVAYALLFLTCK